MSYNNCSYTAYGQFICNPQKQFKSLQKEHFQAVDAGLECKCVRKKGGEDVIMKPCDRDHDCRVTESCRLSPIGTYGSVRVCLPDDVQQAMTLINLPPR
jgi:hypothetical protein